MTTEESFLQSSAQGAVKRWVSNKRRTTAQKNGFRKDRTLWHFSAEYHRERTKVVSAVIQCKVDDGRLAVERQRDVDVQPAQQGSEPRGLFLFCEGWDERVGRALEAYMSALVNGRCSSVYYSGVRPSAKQHVFLNVSPSSRFLAHPRLITQEHTDSCNCK